VREGVDGDGSGQAEKPLLEAGRHGPVAEIEEHGRVVVRGNVDGEEEAQVDGIVGQARHVHVLHVPLERP